MPEVNIFSAFFQGINVAIALFQSVVKSAIKGNVTEKYLRAMEPRDWYEEIDYQAFCLAKR